MGQEQGASLTWSSDMAWDILIELAGGYCGKGEVDQVCKTVGGSGQGIEVGGTAIEVDLIASRQATWTQQQQA